MDRSGLSPLAPVTGAFRGQAGSAGGPRAGPSTPLPVKRRAPIACKRCRRMRSKCLHDKAKPPCTACIEAGLGAEDCIFPVRGAPDDDRQYRHPRQRSEKTLSSAARREMAKARRAVLAKEKSSAAKGKPKAIDPDPWKNLPPLEDLIDGVDRFTRHYFQLGFIPKKQFPERLRRNHKQVNVFLLMSILSISARLSPALSARYGNGIKAAEYFMERAAILAVGEVYQEPSLERCQGFYLLSISQQGSGLQNKSFINMGIAMRMAALMQLHQEETYRLLDPTPELVIRAESARRTLWMLHSQDSLHSGPSCPVSLGVADITALLPCEEDDFANGRNPVSRAALEGTQPASENPELICDPNRSLFASLMQVHHFWGIVGRRAVKFARSSQPWASSSDFSQMVRKLAAWEHGLPERHTFSLSNLHRYKEQGEDLAYLSLTMMTRLCNIVVRRPYLTDIIKLRNQGDHGQHAFFATLSTELFRNVHYLFQQIDAQFSNRSPDESVGAQIAAFCVYSCGVFSAYLCKYPGLCQDSSIACRGPYMLSRTTAILMECKEVWPLAIRWAESLDKFAQDPQATTLVNPGTMADSDEPVPRALTPTARRRSAPVPQSPTQRSMSSSSSLASPLTSPESMETNDMNITNTEARFDNVTSPNQQQQQQQQQQAIFNTTHPPRVPPLVLSTQAFPFPESSPIYSPPNTLHHSPQGQRRESAQMFLSPMTTTYPSHSMDSSAGMVLGPFSSGQQAPGLMTYDINSTVPLYQQLGPSTDGFDGELQFYFDGSTSWMPPMSSGWMEEI
ncbi:hypothetical protein S40288_00822 [Stachybotrys chartarum IBT 40288]|nr:hypothetical protein S40288_00822 [Stachybotrys chartarum IBT 40288]